MRTMGRWIAFGSGGMAVLALCSCGGQINPGTEIEGELTRDSQVFSEVWDEGVELMLTRGIPLDEDMYCDAYTLGGGSLAIDVRSRDFDPVLFVLDGDGGLVTWNDDWDEEKDSRVVLEDASGLTLIVGSLDGERGEYEIGCEEASGSDLDEYLETVDLIGNGSITAWVVDDKDYELLEDMVVEDVEYYVWLEETNIWATGFSLDEQSLVSITVESRDFSPVMILLERDGDETEYLAYNDYYAEGGARIDWMVDPGDYMVVITSYQGCEDGEFDLSIEIENDLEALRADYIPASDPGTSYEGEIEAGRCLLSTVWPQISSGEYYEVYATGSEPTAVFELDIPETGFYELVANGGSTDVSLLLLREKEEGDLEYIDYMSYSTDGKYNTRISSVFTPGRYLAVVFPYYGGQNLTVRFSYSENSGVIETLEPGETMWPYLDYTTTQVVYRIAARAGRTYVVTANSDYVDPVIELYFGDGERLMDDDGGGGYNSRLVFEVEDATECLLLVRTFGGWEEGEVQVTLELGDSTMVPAGGARRVPGEQAPEPPGEPGAPSGESSVEPIL